MLVFEEVITDGWFLCSLAFAVISAISASAYSENAKDPNWKQKLTVASIVLLLESVGLMLCFVFVAPNRWQDYISLYLFSFVFWIVVIVGVILLLAMTWAVIKIIALPFKGVFFVVEWMFTRNKRKVHRLEDKKVKEVS